MPRDYDQPDDYDDDHRGPGVQPHRGVTVLVLGILGLMVCGIFGIPAFMMGKRDLELIRQGRMDKEGESLTKVGYILGIIGTVFFCLQILFIAFYVVLIGAMVAGK